jgi:hypothetical protein
MITDSEAAIIREWLEHTHELRPLRPYSDRLRGPYIISVVAESPEEAAALVREAEELGFKAEQSTLVLCSADYATLHIVDIATYLWVGITGATALLKQLNELPENWNKLKTKLLGEKGRRLTQHEAFSFEAVNRWLDEKYGPTKWRYDPDAVRTSVAATVFTVVMLDEEISGNRHLLAVRDESVRELPAEWRPPDPATKQK